MPFFGPSIRNGLPIGLGSVAGFGIAPFSPADLFSAGEQGAWYDPSDLTTLFTDSAGTTPVTGVEQFVGLMLDKSKGLVLGSELVTNGDFSSGTTGWTALSGSWTVSNGRLIAGNTDGIKRYAQSASNIVAGRWYKATWNQYAGAGTGAANWTVPGIWNGSENLLNGGNYINGTGEKTIYFVAPVSGQFYIYNFEQEVEYDNISVRELPGNHATSTGTKRPKLAARYNLLTYTEQFDNAVWTRRGIKAFGSGSVANTTATADPLGGNTADYIQEDTSSGAHQVDNSQSLPNATSFTFSVYCKAAQRTWAYIRLAVTSGQGAFFNLANGTIGTVQAGITASISNAGNGWYRCFVSITTTTAAGWFPGVCPAPGDNQDSYTGDGTSGIYIWGADLRPASQATGLIGPTYQRVVDAATYDAVGFLPYLQFDGIDDSMSTNSINPGAVDKAQVFAGTRKQADSVQQIIVEQSAAWSANNGAFVLQGVSTNQQWGVRGTANNARNYGTYTAPITQVLAAQLTTAAANSSAAIAARINGADVIGVNDASAISTGNFGNHPLFIGARNNAGNYFNGWLSSLIVRFGATLSQSQIEATEAWVNQKTGAF